jgi:DNA-binding MarR family transcriptional regulator
MLSQEIITALPLFSRTLRRMASEVVKESLTLEQLRVLALIKEGHIQTEISKILSVSMPATSKMIEILVQKKLLTRNVGEDRRCHKLVLTKKGLDLWNKVRKSLSGKVEKALENFSLQDKKRLQECLPVIEQLNHLLNEDQVC